MKTNKTLNLALLAVLLLPSAYADNVAVGRNIDLLENLGDDVEVEMKETECVENRRSVRYTQSEWDGKDRSACYYLEIKNAYFSYNGDNQQNGPHTFRTRPFLSQRFTAVFSDSIEDQECSTAIAGALQRKLRGGDNGLYHFAEGHSRAGSQMEYLDIPQFEIRGISDDGHIELDTAKDPVLGIGHRTFVYEKVVNTSGGDRLPARSFQRNEEGRTPCQPAMFAQEDKVKIVDQVYTQVDDPDATALDHVNNAGRNVGTAINRGIENFFGFFGRRNNGGAQNQ